METDLYLKGGGKKATHDYSKKCFDIGQVSRVGVQLYTTMASNWFSPLMTTADNRRLGATYLLLHSEHVVLSLDALVGNNALEQRTAVRHNHWILEGSTALAECFAQLQHLQPQIIATATALMKASRSRKKRAAEDDLNDTVEGNDGDTV